MSSVLVLGGSGMLGSMVVDQLSPVRDLDVTVTTRNGMPATKAAADLRHRAFDAQVDDPAALLAELPEGTWVVNAIGTIKPFIDESDGMSRLRALQVNGMFPHRLAAASETAGARVLQIATDCVYSGVTGGYDEQAAHDALDVYGKTKSLGEAPSAAMMHLRVSIIGPELSGHVSLLDWFRGLAPGASVTGFDNHFWNGVTTLHFARLALGVITTGRFTPGVFHVEPAGKVTKAEMLHLFSKSFDRHDIDITTAPAKQPVDRTLSTIHQAENNQRWVDAGYPQPPTVGDMIEELAASGIEKW